MQSGRETRCQNGERPRMRTGRGVRGVTPKGWVGWCVPGRRAAFWRLQSIVGGRQCARGRWCRVSMRWTTVSGLYSLLSIPYRILHDVATVSEAVSNGFPHLAPNDGPRVPECLVASLVAVQFNVHPTHSTPRMCGFLRDASRPPPPSLRRGRLCHFVLTHILA